MYSDRSYDPRDPRDHRNQSNSRPNSHGDHNNLNNNSSYSSYASGSQQGYRDSNYNNNNNNNYSRSYNNGYDPQARNYSNNGNYSNSQGSLNSSYSNSTTQDNRNAGYNQHQYNDGSYRAPSRSLGESSGSFGLNYGNASSTNYSSSRDPRLASTSSAGGRPVRPNDHTPSYHPYSQTNRSAVPVASASLTPITSTTSTDVITSSTDATTKVPGLPLPSALPCVNSSTSMEMDTSTGSSPLITTVPSKEASSTSNLVAPAPPVLSKAARKQLNKEKRQLALASMPEEERLEVLAKRAAQSSKQLEENRLRKQNQSLNNTTTSAQQTLSLQTGSAGVGAIAARESSRHLQAAERAQRVRDERALLKSPSLADFMLLSEKERTSLVHKLKGASLPYPMLLSKDFPGQQDEYATPFYQPLTAPSARALFGLGKTDRQKLRRMLDKAKIPYPTQPPKKGLPPPAWVGALSIFKNMSLDILYMVASHLDASTLIKLSKANRWLRSAFTSPSATSIWRKAAAEIGSPSEIDVSEWKMDPRLSCQFFSQENCSLCQSQVNGMTLSQLFLRLRLCSNCQNRRLTSASDSLHSLVTEVVLRVGGTARPYLDKDLEAANARLVLLQAEHDALHLARISNSSTEIDESPLEEYCRLKKQKQIESQTAANSVDRFIEQWKVKETKLLELRRQEECTSRRLQMESLLLNDGFVSTDFENPNWKTHRLWETTSFKPEHAASIYKPIKKVMTDLRERNLKEIYRLRMERVRTPIVDLYEEYKSSLNARDQLELIPWTQFMELPTVATFWNSAEDSFDLVAWNLVWDSIVEECTLATRKLKSDLYQIIIIAQHDRKYNSIDQESSDELEVDSNSSLPLAATSTSSTSIPPVSDPINWQVPFPEATRRKMDSTFAQPSSTLMCAKFCGAEGCYPYLIETRCRGAGVHNLAGGYNSADVNLPRTHKLIIDSTRSDIILHLLQLAQVKDQKSAISTLQKAGRRYTCKLCELKPLEYDTPAYDRWEGTDNFRYSAVAIPYSDMVTHITESHADDECQGRYGWQPDSILFESTGAAEDRYQKYLAKNQEAVADIEEEDEFHRPPGMVSGTFVSFTNYRR